MFYTPGTCSGRQGGVMPLIKDNLNPTPVLPGNIDTEILWVTTSSHPNIQWQVGVRHRPEDHSHVTKNKQINKYNRKSKLSTSWGF